MDRLQSMRVFQQVVDEGGFAAAARKLDLSPTVVTRLVSDLEQHLGVRLLHRTTRRLSLTQAGDSYLERLRAILADIDEAEAVVQSETAAMRGTLRVLAPPVAAEHTLAPAAAAFQQRHAGVTVEIHVDNTADPAVHEYDLAVLNSTAHIDPELIVRPVISSLAVFCAAPSYLERHGVPQQPQDLLQHRCLRLRTPGVRQGPMRLIDPTRGDAALELDIAPVLSANHTDTLLRATLEGAGISSQPIDLLAPLLAAGQLQRLLAPWITARLMLVAVVPSRHYMPVRTRAFLDFLIEHARASLARLDIAQIPSDTTASFRAAPAAPAPRTAPAPGPTASAGPARSV